MEPFGAYLRREREMRGISLREVAQTTKISLRALEALEGDRFGELGGDVFVRGFLRNYARYLGLSADEIVLRFEEYTLNLKPAPVPEPVPEIGGVFADRRNFWLIGGAMAVLLGVVVLIGMLSSGTPPAPEPIRLAAFPASVTAADEAPLPATAPSETAVKGAPAAPAEKGFLLEIAAEEPTYVKLWIDSEAPVERELPPGGEMRYRARERIEILTGNAGGINLKLDGKALPKLGGLGKVRRRVITPQGVFPP